MHARDLLAPLLAIAAFVGSSNVGFCGSCRLVYEEPFEDTDADGLPDEWECCYFPGDPVDIHSPEDHNDTDLLTLAEEYSANTDPTLADTDGDGFSDSDERDLPVCGVKWYTDPTNPDSSPGLQCGCQTDCPAGSSPTADPNLIINPGLQWLDDFGNPHGWWGYNVFPEATNSSQDVPFHPTTGSRVLENSVEDRQLPITNYNGRNFWRQDNIAGVEPDTWYMLSVDIGTNGYRPYTYQAGDTIAPKEHRIEGQIEQYSGADIHFKTEGFSGLQNFRIGQQGIEYTNWQDLTSGPVGSCADDYKMGTFTTVQESAEVPMSKMTRYFHIPKGDDEATHERKLFSEIRGIGTTYADNFVLKKVDVGEPLPDLPAFSRSGTLTFVPYNGVPYNGMDFFPIVLYGYVNGLAEPVYEKISDAGFNAVRVEKTHENVVEDALIDNNLAAVPFTWHTYTWSGMTGIRASIVQDAFHPNSNYVGPGYMKGRIDHWANFENLLFFRGPDEWNNAYGKVYRASNGVRELYRMRDYLKCEYPHADLHYSSTPTFLDTDGLVSLRDANGMVTEEKTLRDWYYDLADSVSFTWNTPNAYHRKDVDNPRMMQVGSQTRKARSFSGGKPVLHTALGVYGWSSWDEPFCLGGLDDGSTCRFDSNCDGGTCGNPNIPLHLQRFQIWNSIINGATGVLFFTGTTSFDLQDDPLDVKEWGILKALAAELAEMTPVLLEPEYYDAWTVEVMDEGVEDSRIEVMMKEHGGKIYLFATSVWYEDIEVVKFTLPNIDNITSVTVLNDFDNGVLPALDPFTIPHSGNTFMHDFKGEDVTGPHCPVEFVAPCAAAPGYGTHIYEIAYSCDDGNECTSDSFVNGACQHDNLALGTPCGDAATECSDQDTCDGGGVCQSNVVTVGTECRASQGACDPAEVCDGLLATCPIDTLEPPTTECRASAGVCDPAEFCDGIAVECPADGLFQASTACRVSAGICDAVEVCDGTNVDCPADTKKTAGTECRASADICDVPESCDGVTDACPIDEVVTAGTECRAAPGECDEAEVCDGFSKACPPNGFEPPGALCGLAPDLCEEQDTCDGGGACVDNGVKPIATVCRAAGDDCDPAEVCDGLGTACPSDVIQPSGTFCGPAPDLCEEQDTCDTAGMCVDNGVKSVGTVCRTFAGACDVVEFCDGTATACPLDGFQVVGTSCGTTPNVCEFEDTCDGAGACADNGVMSSTTECRASAGDCDVAEFCDGTTPLCPSNAFQGSGIGCGPTPDVCEFQDTCDGSGTCVDNGVKPIATVCRAAGDDCDPAEVCDGLGTACPSDVIQPSGTFCGPAPDLCEEQDTCDTAGMCVDNGVKSVGTVCRTFAGACDVVEFCDGTATACPLDGFQVVGTSCGTTPNVCEFEDTCDGAGACADNGVMSSTTECRASAGDCDVAEFCDGTTPLCPSNAFQGSGIGCGPTPDVCEFQDVCDGLGVCLDLGVMWPPIECRASVGSCDPAELCDGSGTGCPPDVNACGADAPIIPSFPHNVRKNRYVSFDPNSDPNNPQTVAYQVSLAASQWHDEALGVLGWVDEPDVEQRAIIVSSPVYQVWNENVIHVGDCHVAPMAKYEIRTILEGADVQILGNFSVPLSIETSLRPGNNKWWGDCVGTLEGDPPAWTGPNGVVNFLDVQAGLKAFVSDPLAPHDTWMDVHPQDLNWTVNMNDVLLVILGFKGAEYPDGCVNDPCCP